MSLLSAGRHGRARARRRGVSFYVALGAFALIVAAAVAAPLLAPHQPDTTDLLASNASPGTAGHLLGADSTGRDTLSRLLYGARLSLLAPLFVVMIAGTLGTAVALVAARRQGWADALLSRTMDMIFAFPALLLAMLSVAVFGAGLTAPILALAVAYTPFIGRVIRSVAMQEESRPYVGSYEVMGFGSAFIALRHVLPNVLPVLVAQCALSFGYAMVDLASLSYLGLGVQPPSADWGVMINSSQDSILQGSPWSGVVPGLAVMITVVCVNIVGEHLGGSTRRDERAAS